MSSLLKPGRIDAARREDDRGLVETVVHEGDSLLRRIESALPSDRPDRFGDDLRWLKILADGLGHAPYLVEALRNGAVIGRLPLAFVRGPVFGRFLVGLPYLNSGGVPPAERAVAAKLIDKAVELSERLDCRFLELRHESAVEHPAFNAEMTSKVHMRLPLPEDAESLWKGLKPSVRNQIRKARRCEFQVAWGGQELLNAFYGIFARRMRELGTPVYNKRLFASILAELPASAELCVVRDGRRAIAAAMLLHGQAMAEVPSAASLTKYNSSNANMLLYWHLLARSLDRGQAMFDFGRCTIGGPTHRFKKQWGAAPHSATWQYHLRKGAADDMRPDGGRHRRAIAIWKRLPVWLTRLIGPPIAGGIP